jgi:hypothetical protein
MDSNAIACESMEHKAVCVFDSVSSHSQHNSNHAATNEVERREHALCDKMTEVP